MAQAIDTIDPTNWSKGSIIALLQRLQENRQPVRLVINGNCELVVQDKGSYQLLRELVDRLETIEGVKKSMESFERGEGVPAREALEELARKCGISS
jgi:hypothetical protein